MSERFERLAFTKNWNSASDFPTYEENEAQVRADMQALHDEVKNFINETLIPGIENLAVPGAGDMQTAVFDPDGLAQDIFAYARAQAAAAVVTAGENAAEAVSEYDTEQVGKFGAVDARLTAVETRLTTVPGAITLLKEYRASGDYTVELPEDAVAVYALAVGAGGGGGNGYYYWDGTGVKSTGGGGGAGGNAVFIGPILPEHITNFAVRVGAGGTAEKAGGASSVFGLTAAGGKGTTSRSGAEPSERTENGFTGGKGGRGGSFDYYTDKHESASIGFDSEAYVHILMQKFSAGGGGGAAYSPSGSKSGQIGGTCGLGTGGKGGNYNENGADGGQCCGGGGAGGYYEDLGDDERGDPIHERYKGGKGGDGYVAIWVQRCSAGE